MLCPAHKAAAKVCKFKKSTKLARQSIDGAAGPTYNLASNPERRAFSGRNQP